METSWFLLKLLCASCSCARMNPRHSQPGCCTAQDRSRARPPRPRRRRRRTQLGLRPVAQGPHPSPTPRRPANGRAVEPTRRARSLASGRQQGQGLCPAEWCRCGALQTGRAWRTRPRTLRAVRLSCSRPVARGPPNPHPQHPANGTLGPRRTRSRTAHTRKNWRGAHPTLTPSTPQIGRRAHAAHQRWRTARSQKNREKQDTAWVTKTTFAPPASRFVGH